MGFKHKNKSYMVIINIYWTPPCVRPCIKYFSVLLSLISPLPMREVLTFPFMDEKIEAVVSKEGSRVQIEFRFVSVEMFLNLSVEGTAFLDSVESGISDLVPESSCHRNNMYIIGS